ncbi:MAG TPA: acetoacetate decarboxylase family protein [Actinomycetota bacterium]|jgi:hypothetical protein|nr:acetoacetate decarboxylase family protein [Actinomycetota bacterium]
MPIQGTLDVSPRISEAPLASDLATEPVVLEKAQVLQVMFEIASAHIDDLLPPALQRTDPPVATFVVIKAVDSALGTFTLAQTRVGCRAGARPRGFVTGGYIDTPIPALEKRWGFGLAPASVTLGGRYHDVEAEVSVDGRPILVTSLVDPVPLSGAEIQFAASMQLARVIRDGKEKPRLVQVDPELTFHRASRGRPRLDVFAADAWGDGRIEPVYPVSAWYAVCDLSLPRVRYICDPALPAFQGTEKLA